MGGQHVRVCMWARSPANRCLHDGAQANFDALIFLSNAAAAFGLNMSVFLLIGKTSALTMNIAGVVKDWLLIGLSVLIFKAQVRACSAWLSHRPMFSSASPSSSLVAQVWAQCPLSWLSYGD